MPMGFDFLCESCGKRLTVPPGLYEKKVRGRVVTIACKTCNAPIRIDATEPPPPVQSVGETASPAPAPPVIPKAARIPEADVPEPLASLRAPLLSSAPPSSGDFPEVDAGWDDSDDAADEAPALDQTDAGDQALTADELPAADEASTVDEAPESDDVLDALAADELPARSPEFDVYAASTEPPPAQGRRRASRSEPPFAPAPRPTVPLGASWIPTSEERAPLPSSEPTRFDGTRPERIPQSSPRAASSPSVSSSPTATEAFASNTPSGPTRPEGQSTFADESSVGGTDEPPPISHITGPISARAPIAKLGRYALFDKFASGGMATVHLGRLDGAGGFSRVVAIKRLLPHLVQSGEFSEMLLNEARLAARVRHPNVVPTLDVVASKGEVLLVLEYVHGESLSALCRTQAKQRGVVPVGVAVSIVLGLLQGLHAVHDATDERGRSLGLVHRDVSPQNVMVGVDGMARVLDFGIVKALEQIEETVPNRLKGKTGYMSPEQIRGERLTRSSDIFAAGIVLWELLTLRRFSAAATDRERIDKIMASNYARPSSIRLDLSSELDKIVMRALAFDAADRYASAREFAEALSRSAEAASAGVVADWVQRLAEKALLERARLLAQVENWDEGAPQIELSSTPFAVEREILEDLSDGTGPHLSPKPGQTRSAPTASRPEAATAHAPSTPSPAPPATATAIGARLLAHRDALPSLASVGPGLLEHQSLRALWKRLPADPRARMGLAGVAVGFLLVLLYLAFR